MSNFKTINDTYMKNMFSKDSVDMLPLYVNIEDLNEVNASEEGFYHLAAKYFDYKAIEFLTSKNARAKTDKYGNTPFHSLIKSPHFNDITKIELKKDEIYKTTKALLNAKVNPKKKNDSEESAIYLGGEKCIYPFIEALCDDGVKMDVVGAEQKNLLHKITSIASHRKDVRGFLPNAINTIKILLTKGGLDKEDKDVFGTDALTYAQRSGVKEIIALFSDEGDTTLGFDIVKAVLNKNIESLNAHIKNGVDLNYISDEFGKTALMMACEYPSLEIVKILINANVDVNFKNGDENTAVFFLLKNGLTNLNRGVAGGQDVKTITKILTELVENGLHVNDTIDKSLNTALNFISQAGYLASLNYNLADELVSANCDINKVNSDGISPLMSFAKFGDENKFGIAELLLDNKADTNLIDSYGNTALIYAASNTNQASGVKIAKLILENDTSSINAVNNNKESALDLAVKNNNEALVKVLLENM
ncbi:MAG: ankyrin repeat domain-containing protein [Campylobacteraceae bacterium]